MNAILDKQESEEARAEVRGRMRHLLEEDRVRLAALAGVAELPVGEEDHCETNNPQREKEGKASGAPRDGSVVPEWLENVFEDMSRQDRLANDDTEQGPKEKIGITLVVDAKLDIDLEKLRRDAWESLIGADIS